MANLNPRAFVVRRHGFYVLRDDDNQPHLIIHQTGMIRPVLDPRRLYEAREDALIVEPI